MFNTFGKTHSVSTVVCILTVALGALATGCDDEEDNTTGTAGSAGAAGNAGSAGSAGEAGSAGSAGEAGSAGSAGSGGSDPTLAELGPGWTEIAGGGDTICSKGSPFSFFVRPGTVNRVVVDFSGGGACWSDLTCLTAGTFFSETVETPSFVDESNATGIYDHTRADNPFKDWTHVYIPYCTGDIHVGDNVQQYSSGVIQHKGAVNTRRVLDWVYANVQAPEKLMVTGCSAGGYGSIFWAPHIRQHYDGKKVYQFSDSAAGIISPSFFDDIAPKWKPEGVYPTWIPGADPSKTALLSSFYVAVGKYYPDMPLSQFNTAYDDTQSFFFEAITQQPKSEWSSRMLAEMKAAADGTSNFTAFVAPNYDHCTLPSNDFYTRVTNDTSLRTWLGELLDNNIPSSVICTDCGGPKPLSNAPTQRGVLRTPLAAAAHAGSRLPRRQANTASSAEAARITAAR